MSGDPRYPAELMKRDQWCLWRIEPAKNGGPTKVPYRPDGRKAASNDSKTWSTFAEVHDVLGRSPDIYGGVGYFFSAEDSICGVDLDVSLNAAGKPQPWAADIVAKFHNTYRAFSVSGIGLHVLCRATLPGKGRNFNVPDGPTDPSGKRAQIGVSDRGRFFALTGRLYQQSPLELADHQETIEWLLGSMQHKGLRRPAEPKPVAGELNDAEIMERARRAKNGAKFAGLWAGNWEGIYGSQSEADLALCCMLAVLVRPRPIPDRCAFPTERPRPREMVGTGGLSGTHHSGGHRADWRVLQTREKPIACASQTTLR